MLGRDVQAWRCPPLGRSGAGGGGETFITILIIIIILIMTIILRCKRWWPNLDHHLDPYHHVVHHQHLIVGKIV